MNGEKLTATDSPAEQYLLELLALEAPQAERIIRRLVSGDISREQARLEMHKLFDTSALAIMH